jgi:WhiB family redox-sensing transcriptional regulator
MIALVVHGASSVPHLEHDGPPVLPCEQTNPELWFAEQPRHVDMAKLLCQSCPIRQRCLADALQRGEPWGVWGGEIFIHGAIVPTKRGRGRPRTRPRTPAPPQPTPAWPPTGR